MSSPRFTLFAGRTCSGPFRPWGPLPHLSQCRSFRLLARNGFNVAMLSLAQHEKMMRMQDMKNGAPSSRVLQEVIYQAPAEYVTV
jgi:hypothetical protein